MLRRASVLQSDHRLAGHSLSPSKESRYAFPIAHRPGSIASGPGVLVAFVESVTIKDTNLRSYEGVGGTPTMLEQRALEMAEIRSDLSAADMCDAEN
jgi:hypothetical protein